MLFIHMTKRRGEAILLPDFLLLFNPVGTSRHLREGKGGVIQLQSVLKACVCVRVCLEERALWKEEGKL